MTYSPLWLLRYDLSTKKITVTTTAVRTTNTTGTIISVNKKKETKIEVRLDSDSVR